MKKKRVKVVPGNVIRIPVGEEFAIGQVVSLKQDGAAFMLWVFDHLFLEIPPDFSFIDTTDILIQADTFDALLVHGIWDIVGSFPVDHSRICRVPYKLGTPEHNPRVIDFEEVNTRPANDAEFQLLEYKTYHAPIGIQNSLEEHFGVRTFDYEVSHEFYYAHLIEVARIVKF